VGEEVEETFKDGKTTGSALNSHSRHVLVTSHVSLEGR